MAYSKSRLAERMKLGTETERRDFFYYLLKAKDPETGKGFAMQELWGESNVLLIAGEVPHPPLSHIKTHPTSTPSRTPTPTLYQTLTPLPPPTGSDTTSTALSATFHYLLHNPLTLHLLTTSIRTAFPSPSSIVPGPTLTSCTYLRACIDEAMRLSPPVPSLLPREVLAGGIDIDGVHVPEGTVVGVSAYALMRNEAYFPDPGRYDPGRWLLLDADSASPGTTPEKEKDLAKAQSAFCAFSIGPRGCIGKGVACLELSVALARVVCIYDMRLAETGNAGNGEYELVDCFVAHKDGPVVEFCARSGA